MKPNLPDGLTSGSEEDRAVSPVVGVALLIAITVILAAVIGFVVLETNSDTTNTKNARLAFADNGGSVEITHEGGATFNTTNIDTKVDGASVGAPASADVGGDFRHSTGDSYTVGATSGQTVVVIWDDPESDREVQIAKFTVE